MNGYLIAGTLLLTVALQLLCCRGKRRIIRFLPVCFIFIEQLLLLIWYAISAWTNWACLILMLILLMYQVCCLVVWGIYSLMKRRGL